MNKNDANDRPDTPRRVRAPEPQAIAPLGMIYRFNPKIGQWIWEEADDAKK